MSVRLSAAEEAYVRNAAEQGGKSLSQIIRTGALSEASRVLGKEEAAR